MDPRMVEITRLVMIVSKMVSSHVNTNNFEVG